MKIELHSEKSKIILLSKGVDFVGFGNFYYFKLIRKRNIKSMERKIKFFHNGLVTKKKILEIFQGWNAYAKWGDSFRLRKKIVRLMYNKNIM